MGSLSKDALKAHFTGSCLLDGSSDEPSQTSDCDLLVLPTWASNSPLILYRELSGWWARSVWIPSRTICWCCALHQ